MMSNGWALQSCTSHLLSQNFMRDFDVSYQDESDQKSYPYYTSWGASTRLIGALISSHSDERGLVIPPKMSEYKAVLLPLYGDQPEEVKKYTDEIATLLLGKNTEIPVQGQYFRARINGNGEKILIDARDARLGEKINDFELSGYPLRIEYGARDIAEKMVVLGNRISGEKKSVALADIADVVTSGLEEGQAILFEKSRTRLQNNTILCETEADIAKAVESGKFALYAWDGDEKFEEHIKSTYKATIRCLPFDGQFTDKIMPVVKN